MKMMLTSGFRVLSETAVQRCSYEKVFWKYAINLQENTHAEVWFQKSCFALHFNMGVFLFIWCIFSEHFFLRPPLDGATSVLSNRAFAKIVNGWIFTKRSILEVCHSSQYVSNAGCHFCVHFYTLIFGMLTGMREILPFAIFEYDSKHKVITDAVVRRCLGTWGLQLY